MGYSMTDIQDLIDEIDAAIGSGVSQPYTPSGPNPSKANDVFEGFVWSIVIRAAMQEGASVSYEDVETKPASALIFRTSPGTIYSKRNAYTHAIIRFPDVANELEAHIGIQVEGSSGVLHECDVAVLDRNEAILCRSNNVHPRAGKLLIGAECKFYGSTLSLDLGRSFLGLRLDLKRKHRFFVSNTTSASIETLLASHNAVSAFNVDLVDPADTDNLMYQLVTVFRAYKARDGKI